MAVGVSTATDLRERRERLGLSQRRLASFAGCSISTLRLVEHGWRPAQSDVVERIERVLTEYEAIRSKA